MLSVRCLDVRCWVLGVGGLGLWVLGTGMEPPKAQGPPNRNQWIWNQPFAGLCVLGVLARNSSGIWNRSGRGNRSR